MNIFRKFGYVLASIISILSFSISILKNLILMLISLLRTGLRLLHILFIKIKLIYYVYFYYYIVNKFSEMKTRYKIKKNKENEDSIKIAKDENIK